MVRGVKRLMAFELVIPKLNEVFKTKDCYHSRSYNMTDGTNDLINVYQLSTDKIDPALNQEFIKCFPSGSKIIITKVFGAEKLELLIEVSQRDLSWLTYRSGIEIDSNGIVTKGTVNNLRFGN